MIRVAVVDDHPMFLDGVLQTLRQAPDMIVVGSGGSVADAIRLSTDAAPDVMVLDMSMAGPTDGLVAVEAFNAGAPAMRTLMLTVVADEERVAEALRIGANGYALKGIGGAELLRIVRAVHGGETYLAPALAARLVARLGRQSPADDLLAVPSTRLGMREAQILSLIAQGCSNKEIGLKLALSDKTVKHYITGLLQKLRVRNRTEAAMLAARWQPRGDALARMELGRMELGTTQGR